jgi:hypothetical protein
MSIAWLIKYYTILDMSAAYLPGHAFSLSNLLELLAGQVWTNARANLVVKTPLEHPKKQTQESSCFTCVPWFWQVFGFFGQSVVLCLGMFSLDLSHRRKLDEAQRGHLRKRARLAGKG